MAAKNQLLRLAELNIGHANIYHLCNKLHDVHALLNGPPCLHLLGISESRLKLQTDSLVAIPNYTFVRKDATCKLHTGMGTYIHNDVLAYISRRSDLESEAVECMWVQFKRSPLDTPLLIGFVYRNPASPYSWYDDFVHMMDVVTVKNTKSKIVLLGDFNIDLLKPHTAWESTFSLFGLKQVIKEPTRITASSATLLDHIYTTDLSKISNIKVSDVSVSDHCPVLCTWLYRHKNDLKTNHLELEYRSYKHFNKDRFLYDLSLANFASVCKCSDPNDALKTWYNIFMPILNKHAGIRRKRVRQKSAPGWLTNEVKEAMKIRDNLKKDKQFEEYKKHRNRVNVMVQNAKKAYAAKILNNKCDTASLWRVMNDITGKKKSHSSFPYTKHSSPDSFNNYFLSSVDTMVKMLTTHHHDLSNKTVHTFCSSKLNMQDTCHIPQLNAFEVGKLIENIKNKKSVGLDTLDISVIKLSLPYIIESITFIYNLCIRHCVFPDLWKAAKVIPLPKASDYSDLNNFRPISILSVLSKPLEKHIHMHTITFMESHCLFHPLQSGFRKYHSCQTALTRLCNSWLTSINKSEIVGAVFLDFKKAFDLVNHEILFTKLKCYLQNESAAALLKSFLDNRTQTVYVNGKYSCSSQVSCGVPQGSVLGPLLFCIFINDLPFSIKNTRVTCDMFADDNTLHTSSSDGSQIQRDLQSSIDDVMQWCFQNKMILNPTKTNCMTVTSRQKHQRTLLPLSLSIDDSTVEQVTAHRVLGVVIDNQFSWNVHISNVCKTVSRNLFLMAKLKRIINNDGLKVYFFGHCLPHISYASNIWSNACSNHTNKINSLHRRAVKLLVDGSNFSVEDKMRIANILPLNLFFKYNIAVLMFKVKHGLAPVYMKELVTESDRCNSQNFLLPVTRIDLYKLSFSFAGPSVWNSLPSRLKLCNKLSVFKKYLKGHFSA